jgi:hypothetical protein
MMEAEVEAVSVGDRNTGGSSGGDKDNIGDSNGGGTDNNKQLTKSGSSNGNSN